MSNKVYDVLKYIALIFLPALGTLYFGLAQMGFAVRRTNGRNYHGDRYVPWRFTWNKYEDVQ